MNKIISLKNLSLDKLNEKGKNIVTKAYNIAQKAHEGQYRDEGTPYFEHPFRVALILTKELDIIEPELICTALLHDVIEDTDITFEFLKAEFGEKVAGNVLNLTKIKDKNVPKEVIIENYFDNLSKSEIGAQTIKLADRLDNLRHIHLSPSKDKQQRYFKETKKYFLSWAKKLCPYIYNEMVKILNSYHPLNGRFMKRPYFASFHDAP